MVRILRIDRDTEIPVHILSTHILCGEVAPRATKTFHFTFYPPLILTTFSPLLYTHTTPVIGCGEVAPHATKMLDTKKLNII